MSSNNIFKSNLQDVHNITQSSMLVYPKEVIIAILKDFFSKDNYYRYEKDQWGFSNVTDHTNIPPGADLPEGVYGSTSESNHLLSTRLFIGESYHLNMAYFPSILVKAGGGKYVPISINREQGSVQYEDIIYQDGYGNETIIKRPIAFITAGAWEGQFSIDVLTKSLRARDDIMELIAMCFTEISFNTLYDIGLIVKPISWSSPTETDDRNDKLFRQSITLDVRTQWERAVPIGNIIDSIFFIDYLVDLSKETNIPAANLTINSEITLSDLL